MLIITDSVSFREVLWALHATGKRLMAKNTVTDNSAWVMPKGDFSFGAVNTNDCEDVFCGECIDNSIRFSKAEGDKGNNYAIGSFTFHIYPAVDKELDNA